MKIHIAGDHAGYELKNAIIDHLDSRYEVIDHGASEYDAQDDYPPFCIAAAKAVAADPGSLGIVLGGSGNGEQIAANKVPGIRAILAWNEDTARLGRAHNNANVISIGARQHSTEEALALIDAFLDEPFSGDQRHQNRIDLIADYEAERG